MKIFFIVNDLGINEPFGPMILSAILKKNGHEVTLGVLQKENVEEKILLWRPDVLAYSMMSVDMAEMMEFNKKLREKVKIFTILGGSHPTLDQNCISHGGIDAICIGEGDNALLKLVNRLENNEAKDNIPNIKTSSDSKVIQDQLICDLDSLPFMDRELVYSYPEMARFGIKGIWTSRGCAFPCPYCFNNRYNALHRSKGRIVRRRSVDSIIEETKLLKKKYRTSFIRIQDDVFIYKVDDWLKEFADKWSTEIKLPFYCLLRSELITDEMAYWLKKAGCFSICMSIESGDDDIRNKMMRRKVSKEQLETAFKILKKYKLNVYANSMYALPFTKLSHDIASLDFAIKVQPDMPNFSIFMPYPGTDLGDYSYDQGIYDPEKNNISHGMRNMSSLACFTDGQKKAQYNLCELSIIAVKFPILRNLIVNHLIYWPPNKFFFLIHYFFALYAYGKKIFYFKHTIIEYVELFIRTFKHYLYDFTKGEKKIKTKSVPIEKFVLSEEERNRKLNDCMEIMAKHYVYTSSQNCLKKTLEK
jgi:anaerobic magnesium-protoporphyrin IX monomethyl ester cyclase